MASLRMTKSGGELRLSGTFLDEIAVSAISLLPRNDPAKQVGRANRALGGNFQIKFVIKIVVFSKQIW